MIEIRGKGIVPGRVEGPALVADTTLSFWGEVDPVTGKVIAVGHPLEGQTLAGRILIIRSTRGSSATPLVLRLATLEGTAPLALVNLEVDSLAALGCIVNRIPMLAHLEDSPFDKIRTGDRVLVDATEGKLVVLQEQATR